MTDGPEYSRRGRDEEDPSWRQERSDEAIADVFNRFTFDSGRSRRRREPEPRREQPERERPQDTAARRRRPPERDQSLGPPPEAPASRARSRPDFPAPEPEGPVPGAVAASSVRSYAWTGGRTKSNYQLELETLVSTSESFRPGLAVRHEHQAIAELCQHPRSVAEVGALLGVPVGVARVLLADMAELGWITVHHTVTDGGSAPHLMLMERVLSGLRRL